VQARLAEELIVAVGLQEPLTPPLASSSQQISECDEDRDSDTGGERGSECQPT